MPAPDVHNKPAPAQEPADLTEADLTACVEAAIRAPSIHNSQPWRFRIRDGGIDVLADWDRRLEVIDPSGRELLISVGAAVFNLELAMRQQGRAPVLRPTLEPGQPTAPPDAGRKLPELVVRVEPGPPAVCEAPLSLLAAAIPRRHTNRRPFATVRDPGVGA